MRSPHNLLSLAALAALQTLASTARAEDIVETGSLYRVWISGSASQATQFDIAFDNGLIATGTRVFAAGTPVAGQELVMQLSQTQTDLGNGHWTIDVTVKGQGDLFPVRNESGYLNLGTDEIPLKLLHTVVVDSAVLAFIQTDGTVLEQSDFAGETTQPWDGYFTMGNAWGFTDVGGYNVNQVSLKLGLSAVSSVPEPATAASLLAGLSLVGALGGWRRRSIRV